MEQSILFYDSGIGGLSTLSSTIKLLPCERYIYFADNKNVPYGNRTKQEISNLVFENISRLLSRFKIKLIVIACNTATSLAIDDLRAKINIPIIGIEPALKVAERKSKNKEILMISTKATAHSERYFKLAKSVSCKVHTCYMPKLASKIEHGLISNNLDISKEINFLKETLETFKNIDQIVLGCTHYSLISDKLSKELSLSVTDGNFGVAKNIYRTLKKISTIRNSGFLNLMIILSKSSTELTTQYRQILEKFALKQL